MKNSFVVLVSVCLLISTIIPAYGQQQRSRGTLPPVQAEPVGTRFDTVEAWTDGTGVFIRWQMAFENDNVGFNVRRIGASGEKTANNGIILGSKAHYGTRTAYGERYSFYDPDGTVQDRYIIETVAAGGSRVRSGQAAVTRSSDIKAVAGMSDGQLSERSSRQKMPLTRTTLDLPRELSSTVRSSLLPPDPAMQKLIAARGGAKLGIRTDGFYRVMRADLQSAGFNVNADPATWQLYRDGVQQAIIVEPTGAYIEFLGKSNETVESDIRYYFLIVGDGPGLRMTTRVATRYTSQATTPNYDQTFFAKERLNYIDTILNGDAENFWGNVITSSGDGYHFTLSGVDKSVANATVTVNLQGFSSGAHDVNITLNGTSIPAAIGTSQIPFGVTATFPTSALIEGSNDLEMAATSDSDLLLFDSVSVRYARKYLASSDQVSFFTPNYLAATITGFTTPNVRLFDTASSDQPVQVLNLKIAADGPTYDIQLPARRGATLLAVGDPGIMSVATVEPNTPSTLSTTSHDADLVIISYKDFITQANTWADYRRSQGFKVEVVDVADIFDEFNYGQSSANSINAFLQYAATSWNTPPRYVLLVGDGSYDPKNYLGFGDQNLVPSKMVNTEFSETGSDDALADFNGDGLADLSIGRIPAQTPDVVTNALGKVEQFEGTPSLSDINRGALFAYDEPIGFDFQDMSNQLRNDLPPTVPATFIGRGDPNSSATLLTAIDSGKYIVNYSGHGASGLWGSSDFFQVANVPQLTNANTQSIFTMLTCLNGFFVNPNFDSLSETLLKAQNGGAVAAWASSGLTTPDVQLIMGNRFYSQLGAGTIPRFGDLIRDAKSVVPGNSDVRYSWVLIGDPMLKIR